MATLEELDAIEQIKQLKARYFRCMDTKDWDGFQAVFAPDASDGHHAGGARPRGRARHENIRAVRGGVGRSRRHRAPRPHARDRDHVAHDRARGLGDAGLPADARGLAARA